MTSSFHRSTREHIIWIFFDKCGFFFCMIGPYDFPRHPLSIQHLSKEGGKTMMIEKGGTNQYSSRPTVVHIVSTKTKTNVIINRLAGHKP